MALEYGFIDEISGRAEVQEGPQQAAKDIKELKEKMQAANFKETLEEFEELVEEKEEPQQKVSALDAFLNAFS